nr:retrovirus-related Pol polyprotein from transposon TNT 1-94 [Tanacetum cinerariifolium]
DGIARDVFVPVGKFTFPADFVVVDYEIDLRVPLILGRPFLRIARALIDVHGEEMIIRDGDERLTLNMKHDTASYSNHLYRESVNLINIFNLSSEDCLKDLVSNKKSSNPTFSLHKEIASSEVIPEFHDSNVSPTQIPVFKGDSYEFWSTKMMTLFKSQELWEFVETGIAETSDDEVSRKKNQKLDAKALFFIQQESKDLSLYKLMRLGLIEVQQKKKKRRFRKRERPISHISVAEEEIEEVLEAEAEVVVVTRLCIAHIATKMGIQRSIINKSATKEEEKEFQIKGEANLSYQRGRGRDKEGYRGQGRGHGITLLCIAHIATNLGILMTICLWSRQKQRKQQKYMRDACLANKPKMSFLVGKSKRATDLLELVHADLCGPMRIESLRGSKYFLLFIDDYSRISQVKFLQLNSETFRNFNKFKALVEKQSGKDLKVLRTDHGGEFLSKEFTALNFNKFKALVEKQSGKDLKVLRTDHGGLGSAAIMTGNTQRYIKDVNYAPNLAHNLVSVGKLMESGHSLLFDDGKCMIKNKATNKIMARAYMTENRMFPLEFSTDVVLMSKNLEESELWHLRYGHLNYRGLQLLKSKEMVANLPSIMPVKQVCEGCVLGKQTKMSFPMGKSKRATDLLELVHADLCGPMRTESLGGSRYFLLFTDDYSRMSWVYFLQLKSKTFKNFKKFKALVEKQSGKDLKVLRTDRGGEFISKEFAALCDEECIKKELTAPYTPEQNGVVERKNRTVVEMARTMLKSKELPDNFWAEGVAAAVYLLNISLTKSVWNMTPYEAWYGNKPS